MSIAEAGTPEPASDSDVEENSKPLDYFYARYGTFMLAAPCETPGKKEIRDAIEEALRSDSRVSRLDEADFRPHWVFRRTAYPSPTRETTNDELLSGSDHFHTIKLSDPFTFVVTVPIKNQPLFRGIDDVPTDTYFVAWDGITAVVLWTRDAEATLPPRSGGHVVIDILRDALESAGLDLAAQACSPGCTNVFAHRVFRLKQLAGEGGLGKIEPRGFPVLNSHVHTDGDALAVAEALLKHLGYAAENFARYKNLARRIRALEDAARSDVDRLLELQHAQIARRRLKPHERVIKSWTYRDQRKKSRELVSQLWLALARMETLKRDWDEVRHSFVEYLQEREFDTVFRDDFGDDDHAVSSMDVTFIRAAIEQTASRHDTRTVALATGAGGVAGLVGSGVAGLLS